MISENAKKIENLNTVLFIKTGLDIGDFLRISDILRKSDTFANSTQSDVFLFHSNYRVSYIFWFLHTFICIHITVVSNFIFFFR